MAPLFSPLFHPPRSPLLVPFALSQCRLPTLSLWCSDDLQDEQQGQQAVKESVFESLVPPPTTGMKRPQGFAPDVFPSSLPALRRSSPPQWSTTLEPALRPPVPPTLSSVHFAILGDALASTQVRFLAIASSSRPLCLLEVGQMGRESSCGDFERV
ncbi:hypothetical protein BJV78DRAFT_1359782 [Lactifluus subvellereus]|nr:hypothetical protein BJV78DRAFT_1359782 [Lactifluus subvellereus]